MLFLKGLICLKMVSLWLLINCDNLFNLSYSIINCLQNHLILNPLSKSKPFYYVTVKIHCFNILYFKLTWRSIWIVCNNKLEKLIPSAICCDKANLSIIYGMSGAVALLCNKRGINKLQFSEWENAILSNVNFQINNYKFNFQHQKCKSVLNNTFIKETLEKLQHDFVVAQFDKAADNLSFIPESFYDTTLLKEFGVIGITDRAFKLISDYNKNIFINSTINKIKQHFSIFQCLFLLYKKWKSFQHHIYIYIYIYIYYIYILYIYMFLN